MAFLPCCKPGSHQPMWPSEYHVSTDRGRTILFYWRVLFISMVTTGQGESCSGLVTGQGESCIGLVTDQGESCTGLLTGQGKSCTGSVTVSMVASVVSYNITDP